MSVARSARWHQRGDALLTLEAVRDWVGELGLVFFASRAFQLPAPAPSLVEATLGRQTSAPTAAETEMARGLVGRMVAEGSALPLNLLGGAGDVPDFVVSAQVFSYVFTLRGDKNWKQPPLISGVVKVSPLALKVYEALAHGGTLTAAELVGELGREVTENAIVRALGELWSQLRVIPLLQQDGAGGTGSATMWELTSRRFTKQMKAGANAGQPTALSALISLYLSQAYAATEEDIETFLSPLAARSKVRDVLHGLRAGRQLESIVLEGKALLYVPGGLLEFPEVAVAEPQKEDGAAKSEAPAAREVSRERIKRFDRPRPPREERGQRPSREKPEPPFRTERERPSKPFGEKRDRPGREGKSFGDRERRPFQRDRAAGERPSFTKPWNEERRSRERPERGGRAEGERPRRKGEARPPREKKEFRAGPRSSGPRKGGAERGERSQRPFRPRPEGGRPRREGERERPLHLRREGERPFRPRREDGDRSRREGERPFRARPQGERPFRPRREGGDETSGFRARKPSWPRKEGASNERDQRGATENRSAKPYKKPFLGEKRKFGGTKFGDKKSFGRPKFGGKPHVRKPGSGKPGIKGGPRKGKPRPKGEAEE